MGNIHLSAVILAKNEEARIADCIKSLLGWADEIIVADDESADNTKQIAENLGERVIIKKMEIEGRHRNSAYKEAKHDWVFSIDADERPTEELKQEIKDAISGNPDFNAFTMPRRNFIGAYWIKGGGLYPAAQLKLFRKSKFKWEEVEVHPCPILEGACGHLKEDLIHYTYRDWSDFLRKLNNQTTLEALKWHKLSLKDPKKAGYKMNIFHALWRVLDRFARTYIFKRGYRDGFIGFMVACFASLYQIVSYAKFRELKTRDNEKREA